MTDHPHEETVTCTQCGFVNKNRVTKCDTCGNPVDLHLEYSIADCQERGMTFAVPLKVTFRLFVYDKDPETGRAHDARRQGGRGLLRRDPADERPRHLHRQRHRARDRLASCTARPASSSPRKGRAPTSRRSSRTAAPGSSSSTTRRKSSRSASTASASSTAPCSCAPWGSRPTSRSCASSTPRWASTSSSPPTFTLTIPPTVLERERHA